MDNQVIEQILKERTERLEFLIDEGRFEDAISIGEEFDEWISSLMVD
jgi:hypothetical protein|tara:strand:- start:2235 stop:2375 length:141 start_codon:yes stop_codon:yes gene_type:complete